MDAGNYEKDLEDSDAAAPGLEDNWNYNAVSSAIIDSALADPAVVDYTGLVVSTTHATNISNCSYVEGED